MRKELEKKMLKSVKVLKGEASSMAGVESQSVDAVIAAQVRPDFSERLIWARNADIWTKYRLFIGIVEKAIFIDFINYDY